MSDKKHPTATEGSTDAVMPAEVAEVAENGKDALVKPVTDRSSKRRSTRPLTFLKRGQLSAAIPNCAKPAGRRHPDDALGWLWRSPDRPIFQWE